MSAEFQPKSHNRIVFALEPGTAVYLGKDPVSEYRILRKETHFFIYPLKDQDLDSGSITLGHWEENGLFPEKVYKPIKQELKESIADALVAFDKLEQGVSTPTVRQRNCIETTIILAIFGLKPNSLITPEILEAF